MAAVYFESSIFLAILKGEETARSIADLLNELKANKTRIYTSIVTLQEISVLSYRVGAVASDPHVKVGRFARIQSVTRDIALTAAKLEAQILDGIAAKEGGQLPKDSARRKFDCFHLATALACGCGHFYSADQRLLNHGKVLAPGIACSKPIAKAPTLNLTGTHVPSTVIR